MKVSKQITAGLLTTVISMSSLLTASAESVTATGAQAVSYGNFEIHLNTDDTFNDGVILWNAPGSTTSDSKVVSNNRYIKFTPSENGEVSVTFQGSENGSGSNKPRMYIVSGADESCMSKNNSDANGIAATASGANSDKLLTANVIKGKTYYIWPYCFGNANSKFNVSNITFTEKPISITGTKAINIGETAQYGITPVLDLSGNEITSSDITVTYSSDAPNVIFINESSGIATALTKGTANISANISTGGASKTETITVTADYYSIIADADGDSTEVDITNIVSSENIDKFLITTADSNGSKVNSYTINRPTSLSFDVLTAKEDAEVIYAAYDENGVLSDVITDSVKAGEAITERDGYRMFVWKSLDSMEPIQTAAKEKAPVTVTVDTTGASKVEVSPIYTYTYETPDTSDNMLLSDSFADGDYSFEITKAPKDMYHCTYDLYINDAMIGNNVNEKGVGREFTKGDELIYSAKDITVDGVSITLQKTDFYSMSGVLRVQDIDKGISKIVITKEPTITGRNTKVYILGDSLVAKYYGEPVKGYTQEGLVGTSRTGWGQLIGNFINEDIDILNLANSGQWAKGLQETAFTCVLQSAKAGDYMILESGWNDVAKSSRAEMKQAVIDMVEDCERKGVHPILVSPNCSAQTFDKGANTQYASTMREAANEMKEKYSDVILVDLASLSYEFLSNTYGTSTDEMNKNINLGYAGTSSVTGEKGDSLHLSYLGAMKYAELVAQSMADQGIDFINKEFTWSMVDKSGNTISVQVQ